MDMTGWAALITALTGSLATLIGGVRRLLREMRRRAYEQARSELLQEQSARTIASKNREIQDLERMLRERSAQCSSAPPEDRR